jgi:hypothetical protein
MSDARIAELEKELSALKKAKKSQDSSSIQTGWRFCSESGKAVKDFEYAAGDIVLAQPLTKYSDKKLANVTKITNKRVYLEQKERRWDNTFISDKDEIFSPDFSYCRFLYDNKEQLGQITDRVMEFKERLSEFSHNLTLRETFGIYQQMKWFFSVAGKHWVVSASEWYSRFSKHFCNVSFDLFIKHYIRIVESIGTMRTDHLCRYICICSSEDFDNDFTKNISLIYVGLDTDFTENCK